MNTDSRSVVNHAGAFPIDWNDWNRQWRTWRSQQREHLQPSNHKWPKEKNFMADEILGRFNVNGKEVELSEVTFPDLTKCNGDRKRHVGITLGKPGGGHESGGLVSSFEELEKELGL